MKRILILAIVSAASFAQADVYQLFWDKSKSSGSFTDETMWKTVGGAASSDFDKESNRFFRVEAKTGATNTVCLADYNLLGGINYYLWETASLILDGRGVWFRQLSTGSDEIVNNTVNYGPLTVRDNDYSMTAFHFQPADLAHDSTISFSNSLQRFDRTASPHALKWTLQSGFFSFAEPNGANSAHILQLDCNGTDKIEGMTTIEIAEDAEVVFPTVEFQCLSTNSELVVDGGKLDVMGKFAMDQKASAAGWRDYVCTNAITIKNGGRFRQLGGETSIGLNGNQGKRFENITVSGTNSLYEIASTAGNFTTVLSPEFSIRNGGQFKIAKTMYLGSGYAAKAGDAPLVRVSGAGSLFDASNNGIVYLARKAEMIVEDGAEARLYHGFTLGCDITGVTDESADTPSLTIRGEGTKVTVASQSDGQTGFYVGNSEATATLNIEGGEFGTNENAHLMFRIGAEYNSKGKGIVNMSGGTLRIGNATYDQVYVGFRSDAEFNLSGGEIQAKCSLGLNYDTARATKTVTSLFNQTGGKATFRDVDLCGLTITKWRHSILNLDGGEFNTAYVTASKSQAAGGVATATLTADGGTLKPTASQDDTGKFFIQNMDSFLLGAKGLTLDTASYATRVKGAIANKSGEAGLLVKKGTAALKLTGGDYTVSNTRVDGGTLQLLDASSAFSTALTVGQGAAFSLVGDATGATLTGLAVTNGTLALDPTDVIAVNGPVSFAGLRLEFSALPTLESAADFLVIDGEISAESVRALKRAVVANAVGSGEHTDVRVVYDEGTGKTTVSVKYAMDAEPIGDADTVTWNGNGADWATAANWTGGVPTATKKAAFPETTTKIVNVASAAKIGALAFSADGYALTGEGPLEICADQGAAEIAISSGAAIIEVPVTLDTVTALPISANASLTLAKSVTDGGLKKTGAGALYLSATNDFLKEASFTGGRTVLADAGAVNGAAQVKLGENDTLEIRGDGEQHLTMPVVVSSTIDDPAIINAQTDVTVDQLDVTGALIKRGAGTLTVDATSGKASSLSTAYNSSSEQIPGTAVLGYFPKDGTKPSQKDWAGLGVAEGTLLVKGDVDSPEVTAINPVIGMNLTNMDENAQARLVVDGATLNISTKHTYLGFGASYQSNGYKTKQITPTLELKNGAFLKANTMHIGNQTWGGSGCHATFAATNATACFYTLNFTEVEAETRNRAITAAKNSTLLASNYFRIQGKYDIDLDNCFVGRGNIDGVRSAEPSTIGVDSWNAAQPGGSMRFRNGTVLSATFNNLQYPTDTIEFLWDDAEWRWAAALGDYTFASSSVNGDKFLMTMQGKGLILKPASGATFTTEVPFRGEGGFQNLGAGTVAFGAGAYLFTGTCYTKEGATTDLADAGTVSDATFGGAGTVKDGTFAGRTTIALTAADDWTTSEVPTFSGCTLSGMTFVIDYGRASENPLDATYPRNILVAKLSGCTGTPSFALKSRATGLKNVRGEFTVDPATGEVRMNVTTTGLMLIFR